MTRLIRIDIDDSALPPATPEMEQERRVAIFDLLGPLLQRLARERPTPRLPVALTVTERRILCDVAAGFSNAEIAESYSVAVSTVRKHLENTYRKLGVGSRAAAILIISTRIVWLLYCGSCMARPTRS